MVRDEKDDRLLPHPEEKPSKNSKKGGVKASVALLEESPLLGLCISRLLSEKVFST